MSFYLEPRKKYDSAIIGTEYSSGSVIYDGDKIIDILISNDDMSYEDAQDFFEYNILRGCNYIGENKPLFVNKRF